MQLDDLLADGQAQARPTRAASGTRTELNEGFEYVLELLFRNTRTTVLNLDNGLGALALRADLDPAAVALADGVANEVDQ